MAEMIDINELRRLALDGDLAAMQEIILCLKAVEKERDKLKELNSALCTKSNSQVIHNARLAEENDALRAKIERMEKQEPVASVWRCDNGHIHGSCERTLPMGTKLYALPGAQAQPAPSVPVVPAKSLKPVIDWLRNGCDPMKAADELEILIAPAPEAKPCGE